MPAVGDQHKPNAGVTTNPFEEEQARISEYTAQEIAILQSRLDKQLGPEYISSRPGAAGQKVHYLAAEKVINLANEVFGFNGWSSAIKTITIDFIDENQHTGKISLGLSVTVRVTLRDGTYHEDIGYGHIENCKGKAAAFEKAKKEGATDGLKRALRTFGNVLGNCIYDKDFLGRVTKIKVAPSKWDAENLHRHPDFAPAKKEQAKANIDRKPAAENRSTSHTEGDDEFDGADLSDGDFGESSDGNPDEIILPADPQLPQPPMRAKMVTPAPNRPQPQRTLHAPGANPESVTPSKQAQARPSAAPPVDHRPQQAPVERSVSHEQRLLPPQQASNIKANTNATIPNPAHAAGGNRPSSPNNALHHLPPAQPGPGPGQLPPPPPPQNPPQPLNQHNAAPVGFYSARAASALNGAPNDLTAPVSLFNPHSESPSIRKTVGIDHTRTVPVKRAGMGVIAEQAAAPLPGFRDGMPAPSVPARDFVNPSADMHRRIGAPGSGLPSPLSKGVMNGSAYRPPSRRVPTADHNGNGWGIGGQVQGQLQNPAPAAASASAGMKRPPLGDVSNMQHPSNAGGALASGPGDDVKRQKTAGLENGGPGPPPQQSLPGSR